MSALIEWLTRELAQIVDIDQEAITTHEPFSHFGLDSAKAVTLLSRLGEYLDRKIPVTLAWKFPTIEALANHLTGTPETASRESSAHSFPAFSQPIAVIGMACRFPGAADPAAFWDLLRSGRSAFREITSDRWDINAWYDPDLGQPGRMNARMAGLLDRVDEFDPGFFGISPREAIQMDPQQRLALELSWEALEDAGLRPDVVRGSRTGIFVGVVWHDYQNSARKAGSEITVHSGTGQALSIVANRISYALGLHGPSIALDTACSSSLVSVHLACRSLQAGDATLALAGGVNMIIDPDTMVTLSKFGGLSPTSQLCAFDARANGFVRGEGGGFVVLKPLNRALADGDSIYAVIRGTAVNNDGASNGLTAPNPAAQEAVLREACARSGMQTTDLHYVEAHGTGTPLGDPIEAHALGEVYGRERPLDHPLLLGSVKTNIGHLEGASGIAGLIKLILSVQHRQIPPSLNFEKPNPHIDFAASNLRVVNQLEAWPEPGKPAAGGASAFGWGGTNCHMVVGEVDRSTAHLLPLSAPDSGALKATAEKLQTFLDSSTLELALRDLCATAAAHCTGQPERVALTVRSISELSAQLEGFLLGQKRPGLAVGHAKTTRPKLAFVFSPQGSQWLGMGKNLLAVEPVFRAKLVECDRWLTQVAGWSLFDELLAAPGNSRLNRTEFVQPTLCAMQIALAALWGSWGVRPDFVAAHSLGEWAAACVAGALNVEEVMRVVVESSRAQAQAGAGGGMAVVELAETEVRERIQNWCGEVFVAGHNSPTSTILSGDAARLDYLVTVWKEDGILCSLIDVDVPAHSLRMDSAFERIKDSLSGLRPLRTAIPFASSVTGDYLRGPEMGPEHWAHHVRQPVLFTQVIERLAHDGCTLFLEISPHPLLNGAIQQTLSASGVQGIALGSCRRGDDERGSLLNSLGTLYTLGWPVQWSAVSGGKADLPLPISDRPSRSIEPVALPGETPLLLPLSGQTAGALRDRARSLADYLRTSREVKTSDIAYTLATRREHLEHRLVVVGARREELSSTLQEFADGRNSAHIFTGRIRSSTPRRLAFVLSGQGPQWWGMGRELLSSMPIFRQEIARCALEMNRHVAWDLLEELTSDEAASRLNETEIAQPALFALQLALAAVWRSWGVKPDALVGHSVGEVAAAHLGGILSFEDAVTVICHRGRLMQSATGLGGMAALEITEAEAGRLSAPYLGRISIAAVNSPTSIVVSGEMAAIDEIVSAAKAGGARAKVLPVEYAFHSAQMEPFRAEMTRAVQELTVREASVPTYSTVTGTRATGREFDKDYWGSNIRQTVRFADAIESMLDAGIQSFVELSPYPVLASSVLECAEALSRPAEILPSLRRGYPERIQMFQSLSGLFATGTDVDWNGVYPEGGRVTPLPNYPWQRKRFWFDKSSTEFRPAALGNSAVAGNRSPCHGRRLHSPGIQGFVFEKRLKATGFLRDHRVFDKVIVPAPLMVEMALSAAGEAFPEASSAVRDLLLHRPLVLTEERERVVHLVFAPPSARGAEFKIHSTDFTEGCEPDWKLHATGRIPLRSGEKAPGQTESEKPEESLTRNHFSEALSTGDFYSWFEKRGVCLGPAFRVVEHLELADGKAVAKLNLPDQIAGELSDYRVHPVLLDAALQTIAVCHVKGTEANECGDALWLFCGLDHLRVTGAASSRLTCHAVSEAVGEASAGIFRGCAKLFDESGLLVAEIEGARFQQATRESLIASDEANPADLLFEVAWRPRCCLSHALQREPADYLPSLQLIEERLEVDLAGQSYQDEKAAAELISNLHRLSAQSVARTFQELRWNPASGDRFVAQAMMAKLQIIDQHARLFTRMLEILDEEGLVRRVREGWEVLSPWRQGLDGPTIHDLRNRFPDYHAELDLFARCSSRLSEVLQGTCNPLELLFPQGSLKSAGSVYQDSPMARAPNALIREMLKVAVEALPEGRILRILEIGAGTGGTTAHLLPLLKSVPCEYVFSDVSRLFLEDAREKFSRFPFLRFALLDVENSPDVQGFALQQFDLIIAANVLHATRDLRQTLAHVHSLLVPGGLLALVEGYQETRWIDLVFGQTEGWWRFADTDLRPSHPLLPLGTWRRILDEAGFTGVTVVPANRTNRPSIFEQAVLLAKAPVASIKEGEIVPVTGSRSVSGVKEEQSAWLLFGDESLECDAVARLLTIRGNEVVRIVRGAGCETVDERFYRVDAARPSQIRQAVDAALASVTLPCRYALCLWGLTSPKECYEPGALYHQITALCSEALGAAQSLIRDSAMHPPRLWLVTRGAQPPHRTGSPALAGAPLWGLGRVIAVEHPEMWGGMLDLDPGATPSENAEVILAQVTSPDGEDQCAFRAAVRFVPRLVSQAETNIVPRPFACSADGSYLITGGLGGMGLHIAHWLARRGARKLVLLGRTPLPPRSGWDTVERGSRTFEQIAAIREIEAIGAAVKTVAVDIGRQKDVEGLLKSLATKEWLPIYGVVHTAAVADDRLLPKLDSQGLEAAFHPKILGALTLELCLADQPLQFFVCCSSVGALLGQTGQANYAAANAFLDAFVQERRIKEQPALGVNWGGWYGAGLAMTKGGQRTITSLEQRGILGFQPSEGVAALDLLMGRVSSQATVIRMDWSRFRKTYPIGEEPPLLACLAPDVQAPTTAETESLVAEDPATGVRERFFALDSGAERRTMLEAQLQQLLATILKLEVAAVDVEKPMGTLGLDSLMGFEFKNLCEQTFGLSLSATMVWNYPTISALVGHLADKLGLKLTDAISPDAEDRFAKPVSEERLTSVISSVEELSEDEAMDALLRGGIN